MELPHYKNSKISMAMLEPVHLNLFEVILTPPTAVNNGIEYALENIKSIGGLSTDIYPEAGVMQKFKGADRSFASAGPAQTYVDINIVVQVNVTESRTMIGYELYRRWLNLIYNPRTGMMLSKPNYVGGPLQVYIHTKGDSNGEYKSLRYWKFPTIFPFGNIESGMQELSYENVDSIAEVTYNFRADYNDDVIISSY